VWQTFFWLIDIYWWEQYVSLKVVIVDVRVGVAPCWIKLALRRNLRNLHA